MIKLRQGLIDIAGCLLHCFGVHVFRQLDRSKCVPEMMEAATAQP